MTVLIRQLLKTVIINSIIRHLNNRHISYLKYDIFNCHFIQRALFLLSRFSPSIRFTLIFPLKKFISHACSEFQFFKTR